MSVYTPFANFQTAADTPAAGLPDPFTGNLQAVQSGEYVRWIDQMQNGDLVLAGDFNSYGGTSTNNVVSLDRTTGNIISGWSSGMSYTSTVNGVKVDRVNEKIYVMDGNNSNVYVLSKTGTLETTMTGFNGEVRDIYFDGAGGMYCGGEFTTYDGTAASGIVKLNVSDYTIDTSFDYGTGFTYGGTMRVYRIKPDSTGNLIVGGDFSAYKGNTQRAIVKLLTDGSVESNWNSDLGDNSRALLVSLDVNTDTDYLDYVCIIGATFKANGTAVYEYFMLDENGVLLDGTGEYTFNTTVNAGGGLAVAWGPGSRVLLGTRINASKYYAYPGNSNATESTIKALYGLEDTNPGYIMNTSDFLAPNGAGIGSGNVLQLYKQSDGTYIGSGLWSTWGGVSSNSCVRFDTDGTKLG